MKRILHHGKRITRIVAGFVVLLFGLILMIPGVPGPGIPFVFLGLTILAVDFVWAHRLKTRLKDEGTRFLNKLRRRKPPTGQ